MIEFLLILQSSIGQGRTLATANKIMEEVTLQTAEMHNDQHNKGSNNNIDRLLGISQDTPEQDRLRMQQWALDREEGERIRQEAAQLDALGQQQEKQKKQEQAEQQQQDESREFLKFSRCIPRICESTDGARFVIDRCRDSETDITTHFAFLLTIPAALIVVLGLLARKALIKK